MSGKYLLDTNAIIYAINRKLKLPEGNYAVSVITMMELLSWPQLTKKEEQQLLKSLKAISVIELTHSIQEKAIRIRRNASLKLPDSIISATAINGDYMLVTDDEKLRKHHIGKTINLDTLIQQ